MELVARIDRLCTALGKRKLALEWAEFHHIQEYNEVVRLVQKEYSIAFVLATLKTPHNNVVAWTGEMKKVAIKRYEENYQTKLKSAGRPPEDTKRAAKYRSVLRQIVELTNPNSPGIYEPDMIAKISTMARNSMGWPAALHAHWSHNQPDRCNQPMAVEAVCMSPTLVEQALAKLSGDLNYNNVAEAKELLKKIIGNAIQVDRIRR